MTVGQQPPSSPRIGYEELFDVLERVAAASGMTESSASSWLSAVRKVLEQAGEADDATVDLSDDALEFQEAAAQRLRISAGTRANYIRGWKRARDLLLDYLQARDSSTEEFFWNRLERRGRRRSTRRGDTWSPPEASRTMPSLSSDITPTAGSREVRFHTAYVPGVGELSVQLPEGLTSREASALVQFILEQVDNDSGH